MKAIGAGDPIHGNQHPWASGGTSESLSIRVWPSQGIYGRENQAKVFAHVSGTDGYVLPDALVVTADVVAHEITSSGLGKRTASKRLGALSAQQDGLYVLSFKPLATPTERSLQVVTVTAVAPDDSGGRGIGARAWIEVQAPMVEKAVPKLTPRVTQDGLELDWSQLPRAATATWAIGVLRSAGKDTESIATWCQVDDGGCTMKVPAHLLDQISARSNLVVASLRVYVGATEPLDLVAYERGPLATIAVGDQRQR